MSKIGTNSNISEVASITDGIPIGNVSTPLIETTKRTLRVICTNAGNMDVFIKFQPADDDDDFKGIIIYKGTTTDIMVAPNIYAGKLCGITPVGSSTLFITSY